MKNLFTILILIILLSSSIVAQIGPPDTLWTRRYCCGYQSAGYDVQLTSDGGFIFVGSTVPPGRVYPDLYLVKTDANGDTLWTRAYGGLYSDRGYSVKQTVDRGFIATGKTISYSVGLGDIWLVRTDSNGDTLWTLSYGYADDDRGNCVCQTSDGGFIVVGTTGETWLQTARILLIRVSADGDVLWSRTYGEGMEAGWSVQQTSDGGFIVLGTTGTYSIGYADIYLMRINIEGDTLWTRTYGDVRNDVGYSIQITSDEGYIIAGATDSYGVGNSDFYLIKTNSIGDTTWTRTYGGRDYDGAFSVEQTSDEGYILTGNTQSFGAGYDDIYIIRTDSVGDTLWTKTFGSDHNDHGYSAKQTFDGGYIVVGRFRSNIYPNYPNMWATRLGPETSVNNQYRPTLHSFVLHSPYPNPFNQRTVARFELRVASYVNLEVYDVCGRVVENLVSGCFPPGAHQVWFDGEDLPSGVYLIRLEAGGYSQAQKIALIK